MRSIFLALTIAIITALTLAWSANAGTGSPERRVATSGPSAPALGNAQVGARLALPSPSRVRPGAQVSVAAPRATSPSAG